MEGIHTVNQEIIISQLADDTTLFLKNSSQVPIAIKTIELFSAASGLCLNLKKCELFSLKDSNTPSVCDILVKDKVTYLGITIKKSEEARCDENFVFF